MNGESGKRDDCLPLEQRADERERVAISLDQRGKVDVH